MDKKTVLRIYAKDVRKNLDLKHLSGELTEKIRNHDAYKSAKKVMLYYPMKDEIDLTGLLTDDKKFYLPKVDGKNLLVCPYCAGDKLEKSCFNTDEPCTDPIAPKELDLIIVPSLAVDKNNYRLGYGGGFYDRFLAEVSNIVTLTAVAKELIMFSIPVEKFDKQIKYVISA